MDGTHDSPDPSSTPSRRPGEWITHGTKREVYSSWWMSLRIDDVEKPDGSHTDHEVVRGPDAAGMVILRDRREILMLWRHRFLPDTWGWEIPGGAIDPGESPEEAARREAFEETGWRVDGEVRHLSTHHPSVGLVNQTFSIYLADDAVADGPPSDRNEAAAVSWRPVETVAHDRRTGGITDAFTQLGVVWALAATGLGELLAD